MIKAVVISNESSSAKAMLGHKLKSAGLEVLAWVRLCDLHKADFSDAEVVVLNTVGVNGQDNRIAALVARHDLPLLRVHARRKTGTIDIRKVHEFMGAHRIPAARPQRAEGELPNGDLAASARATSAALVASEGRPERVVSPTSAPAPARGDERGPSVGSSAVEFGPPCVVCGKPVTKKTGSGRNGYGWRKTCSDACTAESRRRVGRKVLRQLNAKRKAQTTEPTHKAAADPVFTTIPGPVENFTPVEVSEPAAALTTDALVQVGAERLVPDTVLGERLGYAEPRKIRQLIDRHREDIEARFGGIQTRPSVCRVARDGRGTVEIKSTENLLTKRQALYVITKAGTANANDVVQELVEVYDAVTSPTRSPLSNDLVAQAEVALQLARKTAEHEERLARAEKLQDEIIGEQERIEREAKEREERLRAESRAYADEKAKEMGRAIWRAPKPHPKSTQEALSFPEASKIGADSPVVSRAVKRHAAAATKSALRGMDHECELLGVSRFGVEMWVRSLINHGQRSKMIGDFAGFRDVVGESLGINLTKGAIYTLPRRAFTPILAEIPHRAEEAVGFVRTCIQSGRGVPEHLRRRYPWSEE